MDTLITVPVHPTLDLAVFETRLPCSLGDMGPRPELFSWLAKDAIAPLSASDSVRAHVRDLLRSGGFKPTGRSKPASEYLRKACDEGRLGSINPLVDACNAVSLHSGLPISVVDLDKATPPITVSICPEKTNYVFNSGGQVIDIGGLLTIHDALGPCAGPVKDSQRTKTSETTVRTLSVIWGTTMLPEQTAHAYEWYVALLRGLGATCTPWKIVRS